jgi:hypothetical protein
VKVFVQLRGMIVLAKSDKKPIARDFTRLRLGQPKKADGTRLLKTWRSRMLSKSKERRYIGQGVCVTAAILT